MILVTGAGGFLGGIFAAEAVARGRRVTGTYRRSVPEIGAVSLVQADLSTRAAIASVLLEVKPEWVVNCAGFTNVDDCETDPARARAENVDLPRALAIECAAAGIGLLHVSTDCVFDGESGSRSEDDAPDPLNIYARTKVEGETDVLNALPQALVVRTNFVGASPGGRIGLADWMARRFESEERVPGFADVIFAPLLANDLAGIMMEMIDLGLSGLYHAAARDSISKYEFAIRLGAALGHDTSRVDRTTLAQAGLRARRPLNTSLSPRRLELAVGRRMASVDDAVGSYAAARRAAGHAPLAEATSAVR